MLNSFPYHSKTTPTRLNSEKFKYLLWLTASNKWDILTGGHFPFLKDYFKNNVFLPNVTRDNSHKRLFTRATQG